MTDISQPAIETDALVIGAGPVGLFQVFQLGLLGIGAHVVDALPHAGGQCVELYGDKPIYDIPGVPVCTGRELAEKLLTQIAPMGAVFHYGQEVSTLNRQSDQRWLAETSAGTRFITKTVFIAAGVGAFQPRTLKLEGLDLLDPGQVWSTTPDDAAIAGKDVVVLGGHAQAIATALRFCIGASSGKATARSVTLIHRREVFDADDATLSALAQARHSGALQFMAGQLTGLTELEGQLQTLQVLDANAKTHPVPAGILIPCLGLSPKLGPVAQWGLDLERKQLRVDTEKFATSELGIFAVGDINTYPGKKKLILCGFHEATLAAYAATALVFPGQDIHLQYTTTSSKLHARLGVSHPL